MPVLFMLMFHQSKCISAIKCILFYYRYAYIPVFCHVLVCSLLLRCMLKVQRVACGSEDVTKYTHFNLLCAKRFVADTTSEIDFVESRPTP